MRVERKGVRVEREREGVWEWGERVETDGKRERGGVGVGERVTRESENE